MSHATSKVLNTNKNDKKNYNFTNYFLRRMAKVSMKKKPLSIFIFT